jgi:Na+/phosphate symporter
MNISGYCSVYDESLVEHMSAELGRDVASVVCGDNRFTQPIKTLLIANSTKAVKERERYLETLAIERDAVLSYNDQIRANRTAIPNGDLDELRSRQFDSLVNEIEQIESAISTYEQLLENRQQEIHNRDPRSPHDSMKLHLYLYRPLDTDFPVVSTALDKIEELADRKRMIQQSLSKRIYQA